MAVEVIDKIKPKNGGSFPIAEAVDVEVSEGLRLPEALAAKANTADVTETTTDLQNQINEIAQAAGSGTADTEIAQARIDNKGVTHTTLKDRLDTDASMVDQIKKAISVEDIEFTTGYYIKTNVNESAEVDISNPVASAGYAYAIINCKYKDSFCVLGAGGGTPRLWAFVDSQNKLISKSGADATTTGLNLVAPFNAAKLIINVSIANNAKYDCIKYPDNSSSDLTNAAKIDLAFDPSKGINVSGDTVSYTAGADGIYQFTKAYATAYTCASVPCAEGQKIKITGKSDSTSYRLWAFITENGEVISRSDINAEYSGEVINVPENAVYCIINAVMSVPFACSLLFDIKSNTEVESARTDIYGIEHDTLNDRLDVDSEVVINAKKAVNLADVEFTTGYYIATNGNPSSEVNISSPSASIGYAYAVVDCKYQDVFYIVGTGAGTPRLWAFIDETNKMISHSDANVTTDGLKLIAPFNAKKFVANVSVNAKYSCLHYPSNYNPDLSNASKIDVAFIPSKGVNVSGDTVSYTTQDDGSLDFTKTDSFAYTCATIPCVEGQKILLTGKSDSNGFRLWAFVDSSGAVIGRCESTVEYTSELITVPEGAAYCIVNALLTETFSATLYFNFAAGEGGTTEPIESDYEFTSGYITTRNVGSQIDMTPVASSTMVHAIIDCVKGQDFTITGTSDGNSGRRLYIFVDLYGYCRYRYDSSDSLDGTVITAPVNGKLIVNVLKTSPHGVTDDYNYALRNPISSLPPAFLGSMAFKPMGALGKGYICLITDDGDEKLVSDTIPFLIEKEVPFTFGLMRDSDVCKDATMLAAVKNAIANYGCSVAQHGEFTWDDKSEDYLNIFFDLEKEFFDSEGIELRGAIVPAHQTNELIKAVCGGRFGVVRSGYSGIVPGTQDPAGTVTNYYNYYTSGEQSNLYCLSSYNNATASDTYNTEAVDYAYANNKILICYFHENSMTTEQWQKVSDMVDYAKTKGLEFITLGDIPYLLNK